MPSAFPHRQEFIGKLKKSLFEKKLLQFKIGFPPARE
ncbi:pilS cassette [Neisseria mucosa]|uniref:PilS cassette n=1 Tax=Neisseria mucosa TaxID=488 RepID=A0ABM6T551_NEIMU|nr:pilS cassette [Neisseria mucosa]AVR77995.1 pilS cassette [Neisseria mucosa]